jgi:hypothetical protein
MGFLFVVLLGTWIVNDELCQIYIQANTKFREIVLAAYNHDRDCAFQDYYNGTLINTLKQAAIKEFTQIDIDGDEFLKAINKLLPLDRVWKMSMHPLEFQTWWGENTERDIHLKVLGSSKLVFMWCTTSSARNAP